MIDSKAPALPGLLAFALLAFALLPIFASTRAGTDGNLSRFQPRISQTRTADHPQSRKESLPGKLSWIRGTVLSWTSDSLTLQPRKQGKKSLTLELSLSKQIIHAVKGTQKVIPVDQLNDEEISRNNQEGLAVGSAIQAHYFEQHKKLYAIVIIEETNPIPASQKESGSSYLGVLEKIEFSLFYLPVDGLARGIGEMYVRVEGRSRRFHPPPGSALVNSTGQRLAVRELRTGDTLLITYRLDGVYGGSTTLLETRNLTPH
jgi:hypothetical protein